MPKKRYGFFLFRHPFLWAVLFFCGDQLTKQWAKGTLSAGGARELLPGILRLYYVENRGAAFGMMQGFQVPLAIMTGAVLLALFLWLMVRGKAYHPLMQSGLWILFGGALGNLLDRVVRGAVIDFLEITLFPFPVFNVADVAVSLGFLVLFAMVALSGLKEYHESRSPHAD